MAIKGPADRIADADLVVSVSHPSREVVGGFELVSHRALEVLVPGELASWSTGVTLAMRLV